MTYCPQCRETFADDDSTFCRRDGSRLETLPAKDLLPVTSAELFASKNVTQVSASDVPPALVIRKNIVNPIPLLLGIGAICLLAVTVMILISRSANNGTGNPQSQKAVSSISRSEVEQFIKDWRQAWESRDVAVLAQYYAESFVGNNYSSKRDSASMNRSQWLYDKKQKFQRSGGILVGLGALTINFDGNDAIVSFTQQYQSDDYQDYGIKTLRLRKQPNGTTAIVQEDFAPGSKASK